MDLLIDTHILIWWLAESTQLSKKARTEIAAAEVVYVSPISAWEIEMKKARGLLSTPDNLEETLRTYALRPLPITVAHGVAAGHLPLHHRDPFDRMLIAQASVESLTLMTGDAVFKKYDVKVMLV